MRNPKGTKRKRAKFVDANLELSVKCRSRLESLFRDFVPTDFAGDYLQSEYLSKYTGGTGPGPKIRELAAIEKWCRQELTNRVTNSVIRARDRGYNILPRITWYRFLEVAQTIVEDILGPLSDELVLGSFSGGASTSRPRTMSLPAHKFFGKAHITKDASPYVDLIHRQSELYRQYAFGYSLEEVPGAVLFTVPKNSDIDRCACKEPDINMFLQKGVGLHIRSRLKRYGINLNDQSRNRSLARRGSQDFDLATLDLSSASDSITISCVEALLPRDWFLYLNDIRSQCVIVDGTLVRTEMFSSMGNGFTFELESLIFYALTRATCYLRGYPGIISIYGDDVICPVEGYEDVAWVFSEFGFSVNQEKSFHTGSFRESCGGHYSLGEDVSPFYLRRPPSRLTDAIRIGNQLRKWLLTEPWREYQYPELVHIWTEIRDMIPSRYWGGRDCLVDTQLVSAHPPRQRLVRLTKKSEPPQVGLYLQWSTATRNRSIEPNESGFDPVSTNQKCRSRTASGTVMMDRPLLYVEAGTP